MPRPSTTQQINLRISEELLARIDAKAQEIGIDRSALLRLAATQFIEGKTPAPEAATSSETEEALGLMLDRVEALEAHKALIDIQLLQLEAKVGVHDQLLDTPVEEHQPPKAGSDLLKRLRK